MEPDPSIAIIVGRSAVPKSKLNWQRAVLFIDFVEGVHLADGQFVGGRSA